MSEHWVVQLEVVSDALTAAFDLLPGELADCRPALLRSPGRYALLLHLSAETPLEALAHGLYLWREALSVLALPEPPVVRAEVVTGDEFERDFRSAEAEEELAWSGQRLPTQADGLLQQVFEDPDTHLPGPEAFRAHVQHVLNRRQDHRCRHAVVALNLQFDELAVPRVAERAVSTTRWGDVVGRLGPRTLAVLLKNIEEREVVGVGRRALDLLRDRGTDGSERGRLPGSIGIALGRPGSEADRVLACALAAMLVARDAGGDRWELFPPDLADSLPPGLPLSLETSSDPWDGR